MSLNRGVPIQAINDQIRNAARMRPVLGASGAPVGPMPGMVSTAMQTARMMPQQMPPMQQGNAGIAGLMRMLTPPPQPKGLLGTSFNDPRTQANLAMAGKLMEQGGYTQMPTSLGQGLGSALQTRQAVLAQQQGIENARRQQGIQNAIAIASIKPNKLSAMDSKINAGMRAGLSYEEAFDRAISSGGTNITMGAGRPGQAAFVEAFKETADSTKSSNQIIRDIDPLIDLLANGLQTGFGQSAVLGTQRILARLMPDASPEMLNSIAAGEQFAATLNTIILPKVKMLGINPTDADLRFVKGSMADLSKTPLGNMVLLKMVRLQEQRTLALNEAERSYMEKNFGNEEPIKVLMGARRARDAVPSQRPDLFGDDVVAKLREEARAAVSASRQGEPDVDITDFTTGQS